MLIKKNFSKTAMQKLEIHNYGNVTNLQLSKELRNLQLNNLRVPEEIGIVQIVKNYGKLWKLLNCSSYLRIANKFILSEKHIVVTDITVAD